MRLSVSKEDEGKRLDVYLTSKLGLSRVRVQNIIKAKQVTLNNKTDIKPHHKIKSKDTIVVNLPSQEELNITPEDIPLEILYEDKDLIVINKPAGIIVHPTHKIKSATLINAVLAHTKGKLADIGLPLRPGVVHRLDKDTSGVIVIAKSEGAYWGLAKQFSNHSINRAYLVLVHGVMKEDEGEINLPIGRPFKGGVGMKVKGRLSKQAITYFKVKERFNLGLGYSLLEVKLATGRTHQIRVHLSYIGHQVVGDKRYGKKREAQMQRQALHAFLLGFYHPIMNKYMEFTAKLPQDITCFIEKLSKWKV